MAVSDDLHVLPGKFAYARSVSAPFWSMPGFAIPLFQLNDRSNAVYVQRVDEARKITGFDLFKDAPGAVPLKSPCYAGIGDQEVFALLDPSAVAYAGTRPKLSSVVKAWVSKIEAPLQRMSFARFCGDGRLAERAAAEAVKVKASEFRSENQAIRWFIDAVVLTELLTTLAASKRVAHVKISNDLLERVRVGVHLSKSLRIQIEVPRSLLQRDIKQTNNYGGKLARLLRLLHSATGREVDIKGVEEERGSWSARETVALTREAAETERVDRLLAEIRRCPRQEERVALLIRALISDRAAAWTVLENYSDRAGFAQNAIDHLREALRPEMKKNEFDRTIENELSRIISEAYPLNRGRVLLSFAHILGKHPKFANIIRDRTLRSNSRDVAMSRDAILNELS